MHLISVTTALSPFFDASKIKPDVLEFAKLRGTETHQGCAAYARSLPVFLSEPARPYFESFRNWFDKYVKRVLFVEAEFSDPHVYGIVGHVDLVAELTDGRIVVVDYKTPVVESMTWRAQLAAYCYLINPIVVDGGGMALMLSPEGNAARAIHYKQQASDFANFLAALQAWRAFK